MSTQEQVYEKYTECKQLLGKLQYFGSRTRKKDIDIVEQLNLQKDTAIALNRKREQLQNLTIYEGFSEIMKREINALKNLSAEELVIVPFSNDKYLDAGVKEGRKILMKAMSIWG